MTQIEKELAGLVKSCAKQYLNQRADKVDWEQRRYEIAVSISNGVVARIGLNAVGREDEVSAFAVRFADKLIMRLKAEANRTRSIKLGNHDPRGYDKEGGER